MLIGLLGAPACGDDEPTTAPDTADPVVPLDLDNLGEATADLEELLGHPLTVKEVDITRSGYTWQVRDPEKPENLDTYRWSEGEFASPEPVFTGGDDLSDEVFSLEGLDLTTVPRKVAQAALALELEDAVVNVLILRLEDDGITWLAPVSGSRDSKVVRTDARGNVIDVV